MKGKTSMYKVPKAHSAYMYTSLSNTCVHIQPADKPTEHLINRARERERHTHTHTHTHACTHACTHTRTHTHTHTQEKQLPQSFFNDTVDVGHLIQNLNSYWLSKARQV